MIQIDAIATVLIFFVLALLFYGPWQSVCTDFCRQVIFEKRDAIFDMAAAGELDFRSNEYRTIRSSLEKSIRFAHEATLPKFLLFKFVLGRMNLKSARSDLVAAVEGIQNEATRAKVTRLVGEASVAMAMMMLAKSPLTVVVFGFFVAAYYFSAEMWATIKRFVMPIGDTAQVEAENAPSSDLETFAFSGR